MKEEKDLSKEYSKEELVILKLKGLVDKYISEHNSINRKIIVCDEEIGSSLSKNKIGIDYEYYLRKRSIYKELNNLYVDIIKDLRVVLVDYLSDDDLSNKETKKKDKNYFKENI